MHAVFRGMASCLRTRRRITARTVAGDAGVRRIAGRILRPALGVGTSGIVVMLTGILAVESTTLRAGIRHAAVLLLEHRAQFLHLLRECADLILHGIRRCPCAGSGIRRVRK